VQFRLLSSLGHLIFREQHSEQPPITNCQREVVRVDPQYLSGDVINVFELAFSVSYEGGHGWPNKMIPFTWVTHNRKQRVLEKTDGGLETAVTGIRGTRKIP